MDSTDRWGAIRFKVYQLCLLRRCLDYLSIYEAILNRNRLTLEPEAEIEKARKRLDSLLANYNLRNPYALAKEKQVTLTKHEWKILQNSLCLTIGLHTQADWLPKEYRLSEETLRLVRRLHRRFDLLPIRILAGLKARGYGPLIDREKAERIVREFQVHAKPEEVIHEM